MFVTATTANMLTSRVVTGCFYSLSCAFSLLPLPLPFSPPSLSLCYSPSVNTLTILRCLKISIRPLKTSPCPPPHSPSPHLSVSLLFPFSEHIDQAEFVGAWFKGASIPDLTKQHVQQFLCFGFFHRFYHEVDQARQQAVECEFVMACEWDEMR